MVSESDEWQRTNRGLGAEAVRPCAGGKQDSKAKRCVVARGVKSRQIRARPQACGRQDTWRVYSHFSGPLVSLGSAGLSSGHPLLETPTCASPYMPEACTHTQGWVLPRCPRPNCPRGACGPGAPLSHPVRPELTQTCRLLLVLSCGLLIRPFNPDLTPVFPGPSPALPKMAGTRLGAHSPRFSAGPSRCQLVCRRGPPHCGAPAPSVVCPGSISAGTVPAPSPVPCGQERHLPSALGAQTPAATRHVPPGTSGAQEQAGPCCAEGCGHQRLQLLCSSDR